MAETYLTTAARQELALREAVRTGNRHMRRKGAKVLRDVPAPRPWFAFEHPEHGLVGIRPTPAGTSLELRLPAGLADQERDEVIVWAAREMKEHAKKSSPE